MRPLLRPALFVLAGLLSLSAEAKRFTVMSANIENLFDVDGVSPYDEFKQNSPEPAATKDAASAPPAIKLEHPYTPRHLATKIQNFAKVLARFQDGRGPDIVALNEVEVDHTPESTIKGMVDSNLRPALTDADWEAFFKKLEGKKLEEWLSGELTPEMAGYPAEAWLLKGLRDAGLPPYHIAYSAHTKEEMLNGPAIKNVLLTRFPVLDVKGHKVESSRDILEVKLDVEGHPLVVLVNHWRSKADNYEMEQIRIKEAELNRSILDRLFKEDRQADVLLVGDLNSQYNQRPRVRGLEKSAINDVLKSQGDETAMIAADGADLYNLWFDLPSMKRGSDVWQGYWGTLMHIIVSRGLYDNRGVRYVDNSFRVAGFEDLNLDPMLGEPRRFNYAIPGGAGFSDHLPIVADLETTGDNSPTTFIKLSNPTKETKLTDRGRRVDYANLKRDLVPDAEAVLAKLTANEVDAHMTKVFFVSARVSGQKPLRVKVGENEFGVYCFDKDVMAGVNAMKEGSLIRFYGELDEYKGQRQFNIRHASWLISDR